MFLCFFVLLSNSVCCSGVILFSDCSIAFTSSSRLF